MRPYEGAHGGRGLEEEEQERETSSVEERKHHAGEMVQMDGSHHAWFEDRGGPCVLMSYIDDATGETFGGSMSMRGRFRR